MQRVQCIHSIQREYIDSRERIQREIACTERECMQRVHAESECRETESACRERVHGDDAECMQRECRAFIASRESAVHS